MKKINVTALLLISSVAVTINAYENSFYNNTDEPIGIAIQFTSDDGGPEPRYKQLVHPHSMGIFIPGEISNPGNERIPGIKWAFCLDKIYYIENPTPAQKRHHFRNAENLWKQVPITWIEEQSSTKRTAKTQGSLKRTAKHTVKAGDKSLCRDRHFDIIRDEHGKIMITSSVND